MRITDFCVTACCFLALAHALEEHRPKKKDKRQLENYPAYHLERRLSSGVQPSRLYPHSQYYSGPPHSYLKGRPHSLPAPPYAVQMEPLVLYSQRDPLYDATNTLSPDTDSDQDLTSANQLTKDQIDRGGSGDTIYIPHKPLIKVIEKPVYIKEPEPIIEIIIKESNVTLPPPPTEAPPPPQKKKKEEVQVFYVKYKKNPNGYGKDSVIYDKPIPAISPPVQDEPEPEEEWKDQPPSSYGGYSNEVTEPPKPSTTLRTIIKPDSEVYHSPGNNVKVTFGKEGFDYSKRSSKPEDYAPEPKARQLSSFSDVYFKRPSHQYQHASSNEYRSEVRAPQPYRPFNNFPPSSNQYNSRPPNRDVNTRASLPYFPPAKHPFQEPQSNAKPSQPSRVSFPSFSHSISHPPPVQYQSQLRPKPPQNRFNAQPQFSDVPPPGHRKPVPYTPFEKIRPSQPLPVHQNHQLFNQPPPTQAPPHVAHNIQFRPESHFSGQQPSFAEVNTHQAQKANKQPVQYNQYQQQPQYQEHYNNLKAAQNVLPPGGELVHSLPKFEQHLIVDAATGQQAQAAPQQQFSVSSHKTLESLTRLNKQGKSQAVQNPPQQYDFQSAANQRSTEQLVRTYSTTTPKPTTTTREPEKPSTTTKDPKILEAQLPDEVPPELREQLLSSGILNNADISILDYDKVGDIPLSALPPDQLANFYSAGGAQQLAAAGSELLPQTAALTSRKDEAPLQDQEMEAEESEISEVHMKSPEGGVEMKVVKYDPQTDKGQKIQEAYIADDSKQVDPVVLNDNTYNRYLPLKINGTQFPIPDAPELKGKRISSVVVLAPISYDFSSSRQSREANSESDVQLIKSGPLKELLENPTQKNYETFLENEKKTASAKQAVVLLVAENPGTEKEIYMYDVATKSVSKLSGELSSAFVEAAEANSSDAVTSDVPPGAQEVTNRDRPEKPENSKA